MFKQAGCVYASLLCNGRNLVLAYFEVCLYHWQPHGDQLEGEEKKKKIVEIRLQVVVAYLKLLDIEVHLDEDG